MQPWLQESKEFRFVGREVFGLKGFVTEDNVPNKPAATQPKHCILATFTAGVIFIEHDDHRRIYGNVLQKERFLKSGKVAPHEGHGLSHTHLPEFDDIEKPFHDHQWFFDRFTQCTGEIEHFE